MAGFCCCQWWGYCDPSCGPSYSSEHYSWPSSHTTTRSNTGSRWAPHKNKPAARSTTQQIKPTPTSLKKLKKHTAPQTSLYTTPATCSHITCLLATQQPLPTLLPPLMLAYTNVTPDANQRRTPLSTAVCTPSHFPWRRGGAVAEIPPPPQGTSTPLFSPQGSVREWNTSLIYTPLPSTPSWGTD